MIDLKTFDEYPDIVKPRRLRKYVLIWCSEGTIHVVVDEKDLKLKAHDVLTITSGQVHYIKKPGKAKGIVLEFTYDFFCKNDNDVELIFQNGSVFHFDLNEVIRMTDDKTMGPQLQSIRQELQIKPYQYLITIHSRIELILVAINRAKLNKGDEIWKPDALFLKFLELVRANFEHNYPVSQFAKMLGTSEAKL